MKMRVVADRKTYTHYRIYLDEVVPNPIWDRYFDDLNELTYDLLATRYNLDHIKRVIMVETTYNNLVQPPTKTTREKDITEEFWESVKNMKKSLEKGLTQIYVGDDSDVLNSLIIKGPEKTEEGE